MNINNDVFVFLGGHDVFRGLFESHNINFIKTLYKNKILNYRHVIITIIIKKKLTAFEKNLLDQKCKILESIAKKYDFQLEIYFIKGRSFLNIYKTYNDLQSKIRLFNKQIIWCHNYYNGLIGAIFKKKLSNSYFHLDLKGIPPEEELYYSNSNIIFRYLKYIILKIIEIYIIKFSDSISVVSNRFKNHIIKKFNYKNNIVVYPSVYDKDIFLYDENLRNKYRKIYKFSKKDKVILYSGSLEKWQNPNILFKFFKKIELYKNIKTFVLTHEIEKALLSKKKYNLENVTIDSAKGEKLVGIYNAVDIGVICRKNDLVNNVSSPTKIAEYLITKNSLILTESIGDYGIDLKKEEYALTMKNLSELSNISIEQIQKLKKPSLIDLTKIESKYSNTANLNKYKKLFNNINSKWN